MIGLTMKIHASILLTLVGLVVGEIDEELNARYLTMQDSDLLNLFNGQNYTWKMRLYPMDFGTNFQKYMSIDFMKQDLRSHRLEINFLERQINLPVNFDSRLKWPQCQTIREIYNQKNCGSCWTHGVANTASDRICIHLNKHVVLSEQDLECSHPEKSICHPGSPANGFQFWNDFGLVTRDCKPYLPDELNRSGCVTTCENRLYKLPYLQDKHYANQVYALPADSYQIKAELYLNGPIQALMAVYDDFQHPNGHLGYHGGIYEHKWGHHRGYHSVRVIGYGVEHGVDYWLVANSWGKNWGENGLFRIKAFQEHLGFENLMCTGLPRN